MLCRRSSLCCARGASSRWWSLPARGAMMFARGLLCVCVARSVCANAAGPELGLGEALPARSVAAVGRPRGRPRRRRARQAVNV
eukprot:15021757-Alexandrium_andersonii.AAC.1